MNGEGSPSGTTPLRRTVAGFVAGGVLFLGLGLYMNVAGGFAPTDNVGPLAILALIGATVGGLVAPMAWSLVRRWRGEGDAPG